MGGWKHGNERDFAKHWLNAHTWRRSDFREGREKVNWPRKNEVNADSPAPLGYGEICWRK